MPSQIVARFWHVQMLMESSVLRVGPCSKVHLQYQWPAGPRNETLPKKSRLGPLQWLLRRSSEFLESVQSAACVSSPLAQQSRHFKERNKNQPVVHRTYPKRVEEANVFLRPPMRWTVATAAKLRRRRCLRRRVPTARGLVECHPRLWDCPHCQQRAWVAVSQSPDP